MTVRRREFMYGAGVALLVIFALSAPFFSYWFSFRVLGIFSPIARLLQANSHPVYPLIPAITVALIFLIIGVVLTTHPDRKITGSVIAGASVLTLAMTISTLWFAALVIAPRFGISQIPFDAAVWKNADCTSSRVRQQMFSGLERALYGKTSEEIEALIGLPSSGESSYCLGPEAHIIPVDREFLQILYDRNGHAVDFKVSGN